MNTSAINNIWNMGTHHKIRDSDEDDDTNACNGQADIAIQLIANDLEALNCNKSIRIRESWLKVLPTFDHIAGCIHRVNLESSVPLMRGLFGRLFGSLVLAHQLVSRIKVPGRHAWTSTTTDESRRLNKNRCQA